MASAVGTHATAKIGTSRTRPLLAMFIATVVAVGCETATTTPAPGSPGASTGPDTSSPALESSGPFETSGAFSSDSPGGPVGEPSELPLPEPTLTDPFAIGDALYDPLRQDDAVVSLLDLMGVGIYARDGTLIRRGDEHAAGDPWLYDSEVRGLIEMGLADLLDADDDGLKRPLADLHELLTPLLPELSREAFIAAYRDSYAAHPDDLGPMVMLGQPIDGSTRLTRVQMWLLFMDGFVDLAQPAEARLENRTLLARAGPRPRFSTANNALPPLNLPLSMTARDWNELEAHLLTANEWVKIDTSAHSGHEGHGRSGDPVPVLVRIQPPAPIASAVDGRVLLAAANGPLDGIPVDIYDADGSGRRHGSLAPPFATSPVGALRTDASGQARAVYTPKREVSDGRGEIAAEPVRMLVVVNMSVLLARAYVVADRRLVQLLNNALEYCHLRRDAEVFMNWHTPGISVAIRNTYDVTVAPETGGLVARAHRKGADQFIGVLTKREDGKTYRGTMTSGTSAASQMEFVAGVAGVRCEDQTTGLQQQLEVVGRVAPTSPGIDPDIEVIAPGDPGSFDGFDLILSFYPTSMPYGTPGRCQGLIDYFGPGPDGRRISGQYASFNDSHFTDPSIGFRIHIPSSGRLRYTNLFWNQPSMGVSSTFVIAVSRPEGS